MFFLVGFSHSIHMHLLHIPFIHHAAMEQIECSTIYSDSVLHVAQNALRVSNVLNQFVPKKSKKGNQKALLCTTRSVQCKTGVVSFRSLF